MTEYIVPIDDLKAIVEGRDIEHDLKILVRCKDCKCKDKYENFCRRFLREIDPSDYCSCAEGREE